MKLFSAILLLMVGTVVAQDSKQNIGWQSGGAPTLTLQAEAPWVKIWQKDDLGDYPVMECLGLAANYSVKKDSFCCMKPFGTDKISFCFQWDGKIWEGVAGPSGDLKLYEAEDVPAIQEKKCEDKLEPLTKEQVATVEQKQVMLASKETCGDFPCDTGDWTTYQCPKGFAFLDQWSGIIWSSIPDGEATIVDHWNKGPDAKKLEMCQNLAQFKTLKRTTKRVCYSTGKISCADSTRVLLTSVDGSIHVCHKVTP